MAAMIIKSLISDGIVRARRLWALFLLSTVAALGVGLSVAAAGFFGAQEAGAQEVHNPPPQPHYAPEDYHCDDLVKPTTDTGDKNFGMGPSYGTTTEDLDGNSIFIAGDRVTIGVKPRIGGTHPGIPPDEQFNTPSEPPCYPESVLIQWRRLRDIDDPANTAWPALSDCLEMNLTSSQGQPHEFDGYESTDRHLNADQEGCIRWDFWNNWPYKAFVDIQGRFTNANHGRHEFDTHQNGQISIDVYEARIKICRTKADASTHDCSPWSNSLEADLINDSAAPSGL